MSRSASPASSLDFFESDASSEEEYRPRRTTKRTAGGTNKSGPSVKLTINPRVVQRAQQAMDEVLDDEYDDEEEGGGIVGRRGVDLSAQELVRDHEIRPLWVDEQGNMSVYILFYHLSPRRTRSRRGQGLIMQYPRSICGARTPSAGLPHCHS